MLKSGLLLGLAGLGFAAQPIIDNKRVIVWDVTGPLPPAEHDFVAVSPTRKGTALLGDKGDTPGKTGERTVVIDLKDHRRGREVAAGGSRQRLRCHAVGPRPRRSRRAGVCYHSREACRPAEETA